MNMKGWVTGMKLKYYMRGLGAGILLTAIILSIGTGKEKLTDQEIISRAKQLGMVMAEDEKLKEMLTTTPAVPSEGANNSEAEDTLNPADASGNEDAADSSDASINEASEDAGNTPGSEGTTDAGNTADSEGNTDTGNASGSEDTTDAGNASDIEGTMDAGNTSDTEDDTIDISDNTDAAEASDDDGSTDTGDASGAEDTPDASGTDNASDSMITFTIERGMSSEMVSALLKEKGLIENTEDFNSYIIGKGKASFIKIGTYTLPAGASYKKIVDTITK